MIEPSDAAPVELSPSGHPLGFRLRHLLLLVILASSVAFAWPRGIAAWRLYNLAVVHADYALCMAGPRGPGLLKDDPEEFRRLIRRRVVAAAPTSIPLGACQSLVEQMGTQHSSFRLHTAAARDFRVYGNTPGALGRVSILDLDLSLSRLEELRSAAWPFVGSGVGALMKSSSHAKEARHSPRPPSPGIGSGLPTRRDLYRSTSTYGDTVVVSLGSGANAEVLISENRGTDFRRGGSRLAASVRDKCVAGEEGRYFTLSRTLDGNRIVLSHSVEGAPMIAILASAEEGLAGVSCDGSTLVAALVKKVDATGHRPVRLRICPHRRPCHELSGPDMGGDELYYPVDIARMSGDTIVSRTSKGITRVSSSRDDGRSWLPWTVAYDRAESADSQVAPFRLLVAADTLLLYSGSNSSSSYHQLVSDDHAASFHAPPSIVSEGQNAPSDPISFAEK